MVWLPVESMLCMRVIEEAAISEWKEERVWTAFKLEAIEQI